MAVRPREARLPRRILLWLLLEGAAAAAAAGAAARLGTPPWTVVAAAAGAALAVLALVHRMALRPMAGTLRALADGTRNVRASDFGLQIAQRSRDEVGDLVSLFNEMVEALRHQRQNVFQRELLLETVLEGTPTAILLLAADERVVYANRAARDLLGAGRRLEGRPFGEIAAAGRAELREALAAAGDALFTVPGEAGEETFRLARRAFELLSRPHTLVLLERLTPELRRREVRLWKDAVRVVNHELNNSLAPIQSLAHSAGLLASRPEGQEKLALALRTIEERARHLARFLEGYAAFARLPAPRPRAVDWHELLDRLRAVAPFRLEGRVPEAPGWFDPAQVEQALINLLKNAHEAGGPADEVVLEIHGLAEDGGAGLPAGTTVLRVLDRGRGMDEDALRRALLPFWTTKPDGTGLGLPLCGEIAEAHGGALRIEARPGGGTAVTLRLPPRSASAS